MWWVQVEGQESNTGRRARHKRKTIKKKEPYLLTCTRLNLTYVYDVAGPALEHEARGTTSPMNLVDVNVGGHGDGTLITYGAWTDRQRAQFMNHFYQQTTRTYRFTIGSVIGTRGAVSRSACLFLSQSEATCSPTDNKIYTTCMKYLLDQGRMRCH